MLIRWPWLVNRQTRMNLKHAEARVKTFLDEIVLPPFTPALSSFLSYNKGRPSVRMTYGTAP